MARTKPPALAGAGVDDVERAFYDAMQRGDIERLMALWADDDEISCVHPGGSRLTGPIAIRASFEAMFMNGPVRAEPWRVRRAETHAIAVHSVVERLTIVAPGDAGDRYAYVVATNVWARMANGWRLVTHHASPGTIEAPDDDAPTTIASTLH